MLFMVFMKDIFAVNSSKRFLWMRTMADTQLLCCFLLLSACVVATNGHLNRFKVARHRVGTSKFSLNPLKPFINLMRPDPMKAAAQRHHPKYLPPPPGMYHPPMHHHPARASSVGYGMHPYRPYPSQYTRYLPPSTMSLVPPLSAAPSTLMYSTLMNDHHHSYRPMASDLQIKAVRIPSKNRRPTADSLNIADSVVRQLLDFPHQQQQQQDQNYPSVLVIEDPDVTSSSAQTEMVSDSLSQSSPKLVISPPVHADFASDSSVDSSSSASNNPEVFVIVSKNKNKNNYYVDEKKSSDMMTSSGGSKLKKYKITSAYDENGGRQVWIIK